jgi:hypothetical protein
MNKSIITFHPQFALSNSRVISKTTETTIKSLFPPPMAQVSLSNHILKKRRQIATNTPKKTAPTKVTLFKQKLDSESSGYPGRIPGTKPPFFCKFSEIFSGIKNNSGVKYK